VGDALEHDRSALSADAAGAERVTQTTLDHADHRFDLPALAIATAIRRPAEVAAHLPPVTTGGRLGSGTPDARRNDRTNMQLVAQVLVHPLAVVPGVGQKRVDPLSLGSGRHGFHQVRVIGTWAAAGHRRQDHMRRAIDHEAQLGKAAIGPGWLGILAFLPAGHEVMADVVCLEAAAIDGRQGRAALEDLVLACHDHRLIEEAICGVFFSRRSAAFWRVVQWGTWVSSMTARRAGQSASIWHTPR